MTQVGHIMKKHGFIKIQTGGGCTAYSRTVQVLITDDGGGAVPETIDDRVCVGMYDPETGDTVSVQFYNDLMEALKK